MFTLSNHFSQFYLLCTVTLVSGVEKTAHYKEYMVRNVGGREMREEVKKVGKGGMLH